MQARLATKLLGVDAGPTSKRQMLFQTAGIEVNPLLPPLVALIISLFTSMGGISGAFLLLPFQMSVLGYTHPSVSATNQLYNVIAIPSGVYRFVREGRMLWPLAGAIVLGTLPGVFLGAVVRVAYLPDPRNFKLFAALVLLYLGARLVGDLVKRTGGGDDRGGSEDRFHGLVRRHRARAGERTTAGKQALPAVRLTRCSLASIEYEFCGQALRAPTLGVLGLSFWVGIAGGIYGIGGGAIVAPFLVSVLRLPVYTVAGAALAGTLVTSVAAVACYCALAPFFPDRSVAPDWLLGLLFGVGGMAGMYLGARCQKYVPARGIKWMLAAVVVLIGAKYVWSFAVR
jgi:uncharacterized membrane protein YfcA